MCGDGLCNGDETCSTCTFDCGNCLASNAVVDRCSPSVGNLKYALTFDDGPTPESGITARLLDILKQNNIKATFFLIGGNLAKPGGVDLARRAAAEGHLILSHTYTHPSLPTLTRAQIRDQMTRTEVYLRNARCMRPTRIMRPPYGDTSPAMLTTLAEMGYLVVTWNGDTNDWQYTSQRDATNQIIASAKKMIDSKYPTSVIHLQHDMTAVSVDAVPQIISYIKSKGYSFVRLDECLADSSFTTFSAAAGYGCLDSKQNLIGGAACTSDTQCGSGRCVSGRCSCNAGYTCPTCTKQTSLMSATEVCPAATT
jgi:peptidoglycan/xylan/chitin deacetylase (PgdA/CDA1 family)